MRIGEPRLGPGFGRTLRLTKVYLLVAALAASGALTAVWWAAQGIPQGQAHRVGSMQLRKLREAKARLVNDLEYKIQALVDVPSIVSPQKRPGDLQALEDLLYNFGFQAFELRRYDTEGNLTLELPEGGLQFPRLTSEERAELLGWSRDLDNIHSIHPELLIDGEGQGRGVVRYSLPIWSKPQSGSPKPNGFLCLWFRSSLLFFDYLTPTHYMPESYTFVVQARTNSDSDDSGPRLVWNSTESQWMQDDERIDSIAFLRILQEDSTLMREGDEEFEILRIPRQDGQEHREILATVSVVFGPERWILGQSTPYDVATESSVTQRNWMIVLGILTLGVLLLGVGLLYYQRTILESETSQQLSQLREVQHDYHELFAENPTAMLVLNDACELVDCNYSAERLIGLSRQEARGDRLTDLFDGEEISLLWELLQQQKNLHARDAELVRRRDQESVLVEVWGRRIGEHWILMAQDVEQRRDLDRQLARLKHMDSMGALAQTLAHDFNNLLGQIQILVSNLRAQIPSDSATTGDLAAIEEKVDDASELVGNLLGLRENVVASEPTLLQPVLAEFLSHLRKLLPDRVELVCQLDSELPAVWLTPHALRRILDNLCLNALDAMPYGGKLNIRAYGRHIDPRGANDQLPSDHYAVIEVTDTGTGVSPKILETMFEPFVTTKRSGKGTGLGLWTVYKFVRRVEGWVNVQSRLKKGTAIQVHLRRSPPREEEKSTRSTRNTGMEKVPLPPAEV